MTSDASTFYITTPIYYVNDAPHIGHAYTTIVADVLARYHRLLGKNVFFLTGTDEHGQKVQRAADEKGVSPQEHADAVVVRFQEAWKRLEISNDRFIRTTEADHKSNVQAALQKVYENGDIYLGEYKGYYHVADETFLTEDKVNPDDVKSGDVVELAEKNYFFKLSKYQDWLIQYIEETPGFVLPEARKNWVLGQLKEPIADLCISRPKERLSWGVELPFDDGYVSYVWFDALLNYLTGINYRFDGGTGTEDEPGESKPGDPLFWGGVTHLIGKDILQHHAIYWPIMLKALGVDQPQHVFAHGWWIGDEGDKISKRRGGTGAWLWLADEHGADAFRYFLLREMTLGQDSKISEELFQERVNTDLANGLGNLLSRSGKMAQRSFDGKIPPLGEQTSSEQNLFQQGKDLLDQVAPLIEKFQPHLILEKTAAYLGELNAYIDQQEPWKLAKDPERKADLGRVLRTALEGGCLAAVILSPVIPGKAEKVLEVLGVETSLKDLHLSDVKPGELLHDGAELKLEDALFPRIGMSKKQAAAQQAAGAGAAAPNKADDADGAGLISIDEVFKVQLKTAVVLEAEAVEGSDKLLKLQIDLGAEKRQLVAGIAKFYTPDVIIGKRIVMVANLKPATIFGVESQGMLLAAKKGKKLTLITTDDPEFKPGAKVS